MSNFDFSFVVVACARWEDDYVVEWLSYYEAIGYDHVFLYCNDDDPSGLKAKISRFLSWPKPFVTFRHHSRQGEQLEMYADFIRRDIDRVGWVSFLDLDEYLRLPEGTSISSFVETFPSDCDCILFNWIFFGPNGHISAPGRSVIREYVRRQAAIHPFTKFIAKSGIFVGEKLMDREQGHGFWHFPLGKVDGPVRCVNVLGENMEDYYSDFPGASAAYVNDPLRRDAILETAAIHHYAFRTEASFKGRALRGLGGAFDQQKIWHDIAVGEKFSEYVAGLHAAEDRSLADFWCREQARSVVMRASSMDAFVPFSFGKPATQSSLSVWSGAQTVEADAAGATSGRISGSFQFHTDLEDGPWWRVDLELLVGVSEVRIYNRIDQFGVAERASKIAIDVGFDPDRLIEVYRREIDEPFGGDDGRPLVFKPSFPLPARYVRIRLLARNYLHLDQVEVYGEPLSLGFAEPNPLLSALTRNA